MLSGHLAETLERARHREEEYLIAVQDTTYYNYTTHKAKAGLGQLQGKVRGLLQHNLLLLSEGGIPLGILHQEYWTRKGGQDLNEKESGKWTKGLSAINKYASSLCQKIVLVQDREADVFDFLKAHRADNVELLVRVYEERRMKMVTQDIVAPLSKMSEILPQCGTYCLRTERDHQEVDLTLQVQAAPVSVYPRKGLIITKHQLQDLSLVVVRVLRCVAVKSQKELPCDAIRFFFLKLGAGLAPPPKLLQD